MDRGLWISWYDLEDKNKDEYLSWLHERYLPAMLTRPGIVSASHFAAEKGAPPSRLGHTNDDSVPKGGDYILVIVAETAHAFSPPRPGEVFEDVTPDEKKMRAMRVGERVSIMTEEARTSGPAADTNPGPGLSRCIQLGSFNSTVEDEDELLAWYARWRMPCMSKLPGLIRVRKIVGVSGWSKHGVLYEFTSLAERNAHFPTHEKPYPELEAWTDKVVRKLEHAPRSPHVAQRLWPK
jgi:hypothetical protein